MGNVEYCDEAVVAALVLAELGECPELGRGAFRAKVTWCMLGDCRERRMAERRLRELGVEPSWRASGTGRS